MLGENTASENPIQAEQRVPAPTLTSHSLLVTLERMLAIDGLDLKQALDQAANLVSGALSAEKTDIFLFDPSSQSLVAYGASQTAVARRQRELGLDRLPIANGGRAVEVYLTQRPFMSGNIAADPGDIPQLHEQLGVNSAISVPLYVAGELRGVLQVDSLRIDAFSEYDLRFLEAVAGWVGMITHRSELFEQVRREAQEEARQQTAEQLITIIAHDIGNYITPLLMQSSLIRRRAQREGLEKYAEDAAEMTATIHRLSTLVTDLLDAGRLQNDLFALNTVEFDLSALATATARAMNTRANPIIVSGEAMLPVRGDPSRLRQALENLLSNAIKHSPPRTPVEITVLTRDLGAARWAVIEVTDRGPGIPPEVAERLFTRFARGPGSKGLGIGLYIASGITAAHGGKLTVESTPGAGAKFTLALPAP